MFVVCRISKMFLEKKVCFFPPPVVCVVNEISQATPG